MKKQEVITRMCEISDMAWKHLDPKCHKPCDCFCGTSIFQPSSDFQFDKETIIFIRDAVVEKLERQGIKIKVHEALEIK